MWKCVWGGAVQTMCMIVLEQKEEREQASSAFLSAVALVLASYSEKDGTTIKGYLYNSAKAILKEDAQEEVDIWLPNGWERAKLEDEEKK